MGIALRADPTSVVTAVEAAAREIGATAAVLYLVDLGQTELVPMPDGSVGEPTAPTEAVDASVAGRAFREQRPVRVERDGDTHLFVPVVEGADRTGILALIFPGRGPGGSGGAGAEAAGPPDDRFAAGVELGRLVGFLIATHARATDAFHHGRRIRHLSRAASMQWSLLPPLLLEAPGVRLAAALQPAYEVGGDSFDYAVNGWVLDVALMDAMGHGMGSALIAALTMGTYRHERRNGGTLPEIHAGLDEAVAERHQGDGFSTGQLARLDLQTGRLAWTNAGHPQPFLIRNGHLVGELTCRPTRPWGLGPHGPTPGPVPVATEMLQAGDRVLFYTDGVVEARDAADTEFGVDRLTDLAAQRATEELSPEETVRRLVEAVVSHRDDDLADDASLVLVEWDGPVL
jgi:hypothetical protein